MGGSQIYISVPFLPLTKEKEMNETSKDSTETKKTTRIYNSRWNEQVVEQVEQLYDI